MLRAIFIAHCDAFVPRFDAGYEIVAGERGVKLCGGERQRVYHGRIDGASSSRWKPAGISAGPGRSPRQRRLHVPEIDGALVQDRLSLRWTFSRESHRRATIEGTAADLEGPLRSILDETRRSEASPAARLGASELEAFLSRPGAQRSGDST